MEGGFLPEPSEALPPRFASASSWPQAAAQRGTQPAPPQQQARVQRPAAPAAAAAWGDGEPPDLGLEAQGGCSRCPSLTFRSDWLKAFGVVLCNSCAKAERLISKVRAAEGLGVAFPLRLPWIARMPLQPHPCSLQSARMPLQPQPCSLIWCASSVCCPSPCCWPAEHSQTDIQRQRRRPGQAGQPAQVQPPQGRLDAHAAVPGVAGGCCCLLRCFALVGEKPSQLFLESQVGERRYKLCVLISSMRHPCARRSVCKALVQLCPGVWRRGWLLAET